MYSAFLVTQLFALAVAHNILEWKSRKTLPEGKEHHVFAKLCTAVDSDEAAAHNVVVKSLRMGFLSVRTARSMDDDNVILKQSCSVVYLVDRVNASIAKQMLDLMFEGTLVVIVCMQQNHASVAQ